MKSSDSIIFELLTTVQMTDADGWRYSASENEENTVFHSSPNSNPYDFVLLLIFLKFQYFLKAIAHLSDENLGEKSSQDQLGSKWMSKKVASGIKITSNFQLNFAIMR
jgi:hypothetical protein